MSPAKPTLGLTHDVILHVNNSITCGLITKNFTYRTQISPSFIPRFSVGDIRGVDRGRWFSFIQSRFDGGAGQFIWSNQQGNNKFADSNLIDVGLAATRFVHGRAREGVGLGGDVPVNVGVYEDLDDTVAGDISSALAPRATTAGSLRMARLFTEDFPLHMIEHSNVPHMWQALGAMLYTSIRNPKAWAGGSTGSRWDKLTGSWAVIGTHTGTTRIYRATKFSGVIVNALGSDGIRVYGPDVGLPTPPSRGYTPAYSTTAHDLVVYDDRLWKADVGRIAYLQPVVNTLPATWSDPYVVGDPGVFIHRMKEFNGRLYMGKRDGLWVFDAGRVYEVISYVNESDPNNFKVMEVHRGSLYYNIKNKLFRLTTGGTVELLQSPITEGAIIDAASLGDELHILARRSGPTAESQLWIFNPESGGMRRWFKASEISAGFPWHAPSGIKASHGILWIAPMATSESYSNYDRLAPIVAADRNSPAHLLATPHWTKTHSWMVTSMMDMKMPDLEKLFNRTVIDYTLFSPNDRIDVSYIAALTGRAPIASVWLYNKNLTTFTNISGPMTDEDFQTKQAFYWDSTISAAEHYDRILIGLPQKPSGIQLHLEADDWARFDPTTHSGLDFFVHFRDINGTLQGHPVNQPFPTVGSTFNRGFLSWSMHFVAGSNRIVYTFETDPSVGRWNKLSEYDVLGAHAGGPPAGANTVEQYYWLSLLSDIVSPHNKLTFQEITSRDDKEIFWESQPWIRIGSVGGFNDFPYTKKSLSFPQNLNSKQIALRFDFWGGEGSRPDLRRYEIEYKPFPGNLEVTNFVALAIDDLELHNMEVEHSGAYIAATLHSLAKSGISHVVQLPWPTPHTIRALVSITQPGDTVPILYFDTISGQRVHIGAEIPIQLDEV